VNALSQPSFRLDGRSALVTGGGRGIGRAAALALSRAGAHVTVCSRSSTELHSVVENIRSEGGKAEYFEVDLTQQGEFEEKIASQPAYDVLVNSAGMNIVKPLVHLTDEDIAQVLGLNLQAVFRTTRAVVKRLIADKKPGSIIQISSQMGLVGSPGRTAYCASKHGLEGMTKALSWELGRANIRVNTVCPTFIETELTTKMFETPGFREWVLERIALGRLGQLDEVTGAIIFLAADASSLMTGQSLVLDGGWTAV
jgi:NAD(P)-dependent dehydrogenase (short-subunit alcohol dehydrogenase family)